MKQKLVIKDSDAKVLNQTGFIYYHEGNNSEAIKYIEKSIQTDSNYFEAYLNKGLCLKTINMWKESIKCFDKCIEINPNDSDSYLLKGISSIVLSKFRQSEVTDLSFNFYF